MSDEVEIPVKPGWYVCSNEFPWELNEDGRWYFGGVPMSMDEVASVAPFRRLALQDELVDKVLDRVYAQLTAEGGSESEEQFLSASLKKVKEEVDNE